MNESPAYGSMNKILYSSTPYFPGQNHLNKSQLVIEVLINEPS